MNSKMDVNVVQLLEYIQDMIERSPKGAYKWKDYD